MPAPIPTAIQVQLKTAFLAKGFTKKAYVNGAIIEDPTSLPDSLQKLVDALGNGDSAWFAAWQAAQAVTAIDTITSAPVLGAPGTALP